MNKFVKYGTVIGFVLVLTGTGVSAAAFAMGANIYKIGRYMEDRFEDGYDDYYGYHNYEGHGPAYEPQEEVRSGAMQAAEESLPEPEGGDNGGFFEGGWHAEYPELTDLEIRQNGGIVQILYSDGAENMIIDCDRGDIDKTTYRNDGSKIGLTVNADNEAHYIITVPSAWNLEELEAEVLNGRFEGENLKALDLEINVTGGSADVTQMMGGTLDLQCENGELNWTGNGEPIPMIDIESENGGIIRIGFAGTGNGESYNYKLKTQNGMISLPDLILEGDSTRKIPNGEADGIMDIEAKNNGTVDVTY